MRRTKQLIVDSTTFFLYLIMKYKPFSSTPHTVYSTHKIIQKQSIFCCIFSFGPDQVKCSSLAIWPNSLPFILLRINIHWRNMLSMDECIARVEVHKHTYNVDIMYCWTIWIDLQGSRLRKNNVDDYTEDYIHTHTYTHTNIYSQFVCCGDSTHILVETMYSLVVFNEIMQVRQWKWEHQEKVTLKSKIWYLLWYKDTFIIGFPYKIQ